MKYTIPFNFLWGCCGLQSRQLKTEEAWLIQILFKPTSGFFTDKLYYEYFFRSLFNFHIFQPFQKAEFFINTRISIFHIWNFLYSIRTPIFALNITVHAGRTNADGHTTKKNQFRNNWQCMFFAAVPLFFHKSSAVPDGRAAPIQLEFAKLHFIKLLIRDMPLISYENVSSSISLLFFIGRVRSSTVVTATLA